MGTGGDVIGREYMARYFGEREREVGSAGDEPGERIVGALKGPGDRAFFTYRKDSSVNGEVFFQRRNLLVHVRCWSIGEPSKDEVLDCAYRAAQEADRHVRADALRRAAPAALVVTLVLSGCTGTDTGAETTASPEPTPTSARWRPGEFTRDVDVCGAVSKATRDRLGVAECDADAPVRPNVCVWGHDNEDDRPTILLTVEQLRYEPPPPRPNRTAAQEAEHEFERPPGWGFRSGSSAAEAPGLDEGGRHRHRRGGPAYDPLISAARRTRPRPSRPAPGTTRGWPG
ncbi:MAG: DUF3558 domain-containing protein [Streptosporangiales bacterium]|nr:DUF3558 domain-containing protein [Streptosporangiales bacterium]